MTFRIEDHTELSREKTISDGTVADGPDETTPPIRREGR
jgi:hypothetical protein